MGRRWLPFLLWWPMLRERGVLRADLLAGLTGAIIVLPQGLAFATLAGKPMLARSNPSLNGTVTFCSRV